MLRVSFQGRTAQRSCLSLLSSLEASVLLLKPCSSRLVLEPCFARPAHEALLHKPCPSHPAGGTPCGSLRFGAASNAEAHIPSTSMLEFYNGGGCDTAFLGCAEVLATPSTLPTQS